MTLAQALIDQHLSRIIEVLVFEVEINDKAYVFEDERITLVGTDRKSTTLIYYILLHSFETNSFT